MQRPPRKIRVVVFKGKRKKISKLLTLNHRAHVDLEWHFGQLEIPICGVPNDVNHATTECTADEDGAVLSMHLAHREIHQYYEIVKGMFHRSVEQYLRAVTNTPRAIESGGGGPIVNTCPFLLTVPRG